MRVFLRILSKELFGSLKKAKEFLHNNRKKCKLEAFIKSTNFSTNFSRNRVSNSFQTSLRWAFIRLQARLQAERETRVGGINV
jgi:hypothetical protein